MSGKKRDDGLENNATYYVDETHDPAIFKIAQEVRAKIKEKFGKDIDLRLGLKTGLYQEIGRIASTNLYPDGHKEVVIDYDIAKKLAQTDRGKTILANICAHESGHTLLGHAKSFQQALEDAQSPMRRQKQELEADVVSAIATGSSAGVEANSEFAKEINQPPSNYHHPDPADRVKAAQAAAKNGGSSIAVTYDEDCKINDIQSVPLNVTQLVQIKAPADCK